MQQYNRIKAKYPDALLLFRIGDFYETFSQDAIITARVLGIVLTKRANGKASHIELAGFPHHSVDSYLPKLVRAGYRVAICEQLEDPKMTKKIVKRGVTELITPGVAHNDKILDHKSNNFLASVYFEKNWAAAAFLDISTGEFLVGEGSKDYIDNLLRNFNPSEVIFSKSAKKEFLQQFGNDFYTYALEDWVFNEEYAHEVLLRQFETVSLKGFGVEDLTLAKVAAGAALHYLTETEHPNVDHITAISRIQSDQYVWLDKFTIRNLELLNSLSPDGASLLDVVDHTVSSMGSRLLKKWMVFPLKKKELIEERHAIVETLIKDPDLIQLLTANIKQIGDLERLISKVALRKINPREVVQLKRALEALEPVKLACADTKCTQLQKYADQINPCKTLKDRISYDLKDDAPVQLNKGPVIADGVSETLDELRKIMNSGKEYLLNIQQREILATGIPKLKIGYNNVFGYYLEVTNPNKDKVPEEWIRKQTLVNAERYITQELKEYEEKILGAEEKITALEEQLFQELVEFIHDYIKPVQHNSQVIARLDCLLSFQHVAQKFNYHKPKIDESLTLEIKAGRHPVIEQQLEIGEEYVPNDLLLDNESQQIIIITGPNMSGKSALLRQTALIVILAQMGSFVPANSVKMGLVDKVFTRVGASDNISSGESTFMVEMNETANIINNISDRSLILLDEIGRGTSTYDGISIAWSIGEFLHNNSLATPKTLFATHYHELNELATKFSRIKNFNVSTKEVGNKVIFLRKLVPGGSKHSFGIHVARMAGMPKSLLDRANEILKQLEAKAIGSDLTNAVKGIETPNYQLSIFNVDDPNYQKIKQELMHLDINTLTPVEAMMKLDELKKIFE